MNPNFRRWLLLPGAVAFSISLGIAQTNPTRLQQNDPSITYTGVWYPNSETPNSGGSATLTNYKGATAAITFNGTGITWIGPLDPYSGIAQVYLDGTPSTVDTYGPTTLYQQPLFSAQGLTPGDHTLSIQVLHQRDGNTQGSWIWIDAFDIYNGSGVPGGAVATAGLIPHDDPSLTYTGNWYLNTNSIDLSGSAVLAMDASSSATIKFNGTGIKWIGYRDAWSGIANVYLDGVLQSAVDTYAVIEQPQAAGFDITGLASGIHTLTIAVTGTRDPQSGGAWVWIDAFQVY
jgi:hypothetical protein